MSSTLTEFYRARGPTKEQLDALETALRGRRFVPMARRLLSRCWCGKETRSASIYCDRFDCPHV